MNSCDKVSDIMVMDIKILIVHESRKLKVVAIWKIANQF